MSITWLIFIIIALVEIWVILRYFPERNFDLRSEIVSGAYSFVSYHSQILFAIVMAPVYFLAFNNRIFDIRLEPVFYWTALFFSHEFFFYWKHRLAHLIPILWLTHGVHHSSTQMSVLSGMRSAKTAFSFSWTIIFLLALIGFKPADAIAMFFVALTYQTVLHSELIGKFGILERWLMTAHNHRIHHNLFPDNTTHNYGAMTVLCDRLFGTWSGIKENSRTYGVYGIVVKSQNLLTPILVSSHWAWRGLAESFSGAGKKIYQFAGLKPVEIVATEEIKEFGVNKPE